MWFVLSWVLFNCTKSATATDKSSFESNHRIITSIEVIVICGWTLDCRIVKTSVHKQILCQTNFSIEYNTIRLYFELTDISDQPENLEVTAERTPSTSAINCKTQLANGHKSPTGHVGSSPNCPRRDGRRSMRSAEPLYLPLLLSPGDCWMLLNYSALAREGRWKAQINYSVWLLTFIQ